MTTHPTPRAWDTAWEGTPSWETGRPQPVVMRLVAEGAFPAGARVLDAGSGSGRHAVLLAGAGCRVTGVDVAAAAVARARRLAQAAGVTDRTRFLASDLRTFTGDGAPFDVVLDVGLFHVLQPAETGAYARTLADLTRAGGRAYVVAWSDRNPFGIGPGRIARRSLRAAFRASAGWRVESIEAAALETRLPPGLAHAWLARVTRR